VTSIIKSIICSPYIFVSEMQGSTYGTHYQAIDLSTVLK
jgi:hypothetical protein